MSETEKMNIQTQGEERAAQEYVQTQELTRNEIMDMAVVYAITLFLPKMKADYNPFCKALQWL